MVFIVFNHENKYFYVKKSFKMGVYNNVLGIHESSKLIIKLLNYSTLLKFKQSTF